MTFGSVSDILALPERAKTPPGGLFFVSGQSDAIL